jgi:hypothetical protein
VDDPCSGVEEGGGGAFFVFLILGVALGEWVTLWQGLEVKELGPDSVPLNIDGGFGAGFFFRRV